MDIKIPDHGMYFVSFIGFIPIFIAAYDISAYAFNRKLSIFSTIVFPLGHINDTLRWYFTFDIGRAITVFVGGKVMDGEMPMWMKFIGGWAAFAIFMMIHRANFELSYLPEHRKLFYSFTNATMLEQQHQIVWQKNINPRGIFLLLIFQICLHYRPTQIRSWEFLVYLYGYFK